MFASAAVYLWLQGRRLLAVIALAFSIAFGVGFAALSFGPPPSLNPTPAPTIGPDGSAVPGQAPPRYPSSRNPSGLDELRLKALQATIAAVAERPILGWGLLTAKDVVTSTGGSINYVDSSYLVVVVEMGLAGLAALLALLFAIAWQARYAVRVREGLALVLAVASIVVISLVAAFLQITQGYALFTLLIALVVVVARCVGQTPARPPI